MGWTILAALGMLILFGIGLVIALVAWFVQHGMLSPDQARTLANNLPFTLYLVNAQGVIEIVVTIYLAAVLPFLAKTSLRGLGFRTSANAAQWGTIALGVVGMFVVAVLVSGAVGTLLHFKSPEIAVALYLKLKGAQRLLFIFFGAIIAPVFEEFVFRVFLFNAFRKWFGLGWGFGISSFLFGLAHAQAPAGDVRMYLSICLPLMLAGAVLAYVYYKTGRAWASMITHAGFNLISFWLLTVAPSLAK